jgi:hypothetical protein
MARKDDVFEFIITYADENCGITPSSRQIAAALDLSQTRIQALMLRLQAERRIAFVDREKYKVIDSQWDPPPVFS